MNRLGVATLTPELLAGPTYELMRGSCNCLTELEYHLEEVYKATTDQLDWVNLEGQQYPHNMLQPLPLIPDNRGRRVIPFEHFINNDLEYLLGGASSRKYTTSVTKTKAADYGHIKWIKDLVPRAMWIQEPINYDRHALWGVSHWGRKRQQFYGFAVIAIGYTLMFLTHSDEALEIEKFKRSRENKIEFAYDYRNLNASYVNEKINFKDVYFQDIINLDFEKIDSLFQQTSSAKPYVLNVILEKIIIDLEDEVVSLLEKEKANLETIESLKSKDLDTFSSVRRPKNSSVICKKKWSSNTSNVGLSAVSVSNLNKNVKRYSRKDLLACNNSHLGETSRAYMCNYAMNISCDSRMYDLLDDNSFFIFDDESVKISPVSKMPFRKKPCDSMNVCSKSNSNKSLPRTMHKWLLKLQPLAEPVAKWFPRVKHYPYLSWDHRFGMFKAYDGVGKFCDKGLEVAFRKSTCFVRNEHGVDLLTGDRSLNLYTITLNEVASNSSTCLLAKASSSQSWLWNQRLSYLNFATINNLVKNNLVQGLPKMKFEKDHLRSACEQGKIHQKHHKSKTAFASNKPLYLLYMDLCSDAHQGKGDIGVFVGYSKESAAFRIYNKRTRKIHESMNVNFDEISEMASKQFSLEPGLWESSLSSLNDDVQQSPEEVILPQTNTQSIPINMIPNGDEASTSHNVFNEQLEDAYFDASTSFHDLSNVHSYYQPYPHEKKWTKDHPLHKIIGDPKSSVRTRGQLANSCLFSCLLSSIEPANVAEALRDADWVSAMQEELDQFARLKVWRLVPRPEGKSIIQTKWIFKNMKDEIAQIEAIRLFLAYAPHKDFTVFQMDIKTVFLNGILKEEVYVDQPLGFVSKQYPDHVYALDKALYCLKQAPRAWYDVLLQFLIDSGFQKVPTPMVEQAKLKLDLVGKPVDHTDYRSMIGSLM
nr:hypothetical protein [Tanacetum cinerariifolium]